MVEGHKLPRGGSPREFFERNICRDANLVHFETQSCHRVLRQGKLTLCALTSACLDGFSNIVTYIL